MNESYVLHLLICLSLSFLWAHTRWLNRENNRLNNKVVISTVIYSTTQACVMLGGLVFVPLYALCDKGGEIFYIFVYTTLFRLWLVII
jgi:amino acid transporter